MMIYQWRRRVGGMLTTTRSTTLTTATATTRAVPTIGNRRMSYHNGLTTTTTAVLLERQQQPQQRIQEWTSQYSSWFHTSSILQHQEVKFASDTPQVSLTFVDPKKPDGEQEVIVKAFVGDNLLRVAHKNSIDLEGACEGACACSTCHVILEEEIYDNLEEPTEDEEDMLDMAFGLTDTSRLGCQVLVSEDMDGTTIQLPAATRNFYVDGHVPKPH